MLANILSLLILKGNGSLFPRRSATSLVGAVATDGGVDCCWFLEAGASLVFIVASLHIRHNKYSVWALALKAIRL